MNTHRFRIFISACIVLTGMFSRMSYVACGMSSDEALTLVTRSRAPLADDASRFKVVQKKIEWDPKQTAIIVCDMWNEHWCKGASKRTAELAPHMNDVVSKAREKDILIIHAPSGTVGAYENHPARKRAQEAPKAANLPEGISQWCRWIDENEEKIGYPIDHSDGGCDCQPTCKQGPPWPWKSQIDTIQIRDEDAISDSGVEIWNLLENRGITNVILMGVHTNMCVLGRPFGLRHMAKFGKNVVLMRDLTDTMYNSRMRPFVNHFTGTDLVVEHIEKYVCATITSTAFTEKPAFRFKNDKRQRVVFLSAESEYGSVETLPEFAHELQIKYGLYCEILQGSPKRRSEDRHELAGLEALTNADLAIVFMRRRALRPDQMKYFRDYVAAGKPLIALRTASHAFDTRGSAPEGYAEWPKFDPEVLGGNYHGHHGSGPKCAVTLATNAEGHPILAGVKLPFTSDGSLYKVRPLTESTTPLLIGTIPDKEPEPVAWTNRAGQSRVFSTSLGHADDFKNASFRRMLINAVFWAMNKPVPIVTASAGQILDATDVKGGLIVHIGCGDGKLTATLRVNDSYLVHGLDSDPENIAAARAYIQSLGSYGDVFVEQWSGDRLPYIDNMVNLVVGEDPGNISKDEILRVLAPDGVAYVKSKGRWIKTVKSRPKEIDEWTHYLHDPSNNAVAHDSVIEPPSRYQWQAGPRYSRQHDHMSSVSAVVSANGRLFYIFDEAPRASILLPPQWKLIARDAFNGKLLWKRNIDLWHTHLWRLKSGPQLLARRLVAMGDKLYVTLGIDAPLSVLDAATGKTIRTYEGTKTTEEILCSNDVLILSVAKDGQPLRSDPAKRYPTLTEMNKDVTHPLWTQAPRTMMAIQAKTGEILWEKKSELVSLSLAADDRRVLFHDGQRIQCLDRHTGRPLWSSQPLPKKENMRSSGGATLVLYDDVVLYSGQVAARRKRPRQQRETTMFALSIKDGTMLWRAPHHPCGHMGTPDDILVAGGLVWNGAVAQGRDSGAMTGHDLHTGEIKSEFTPDVDTHWFHHRCYRAKATDKYLLFSRTGIEFIDHANEHWICHHWVRGACHYGIMPCNGLIYAPQHPCACYIEAKLYGFTALAPPSLTMQVRRNVPDVERLTKGPAYGEIRETRDDGRETMDWPTFRHDAARSGTVRTRVSPTRLKHTWSTHLGGKLSTLVVAEGKLFVASTDAHQVHALEANTGESLWNFTTGGRVDSPPTIWRGRVLFGSADGFVYCLNADDGRLVWRYRAAPENRRMMVFDQLESVWPVHGSVLVQDDMLYCVAGRSMFLDGGLRLLRLDPKTGRKLSETILDDKDPDTGQNLQVHIERLNMPVALSDILSSDGKYVYMRSLPFNLQGKRKFVAYVPVQEQQGDDLHLFCPTGFLDDSLWHRTYWGYGRAWASGAGGYHQAGRVIPAGRPLVFDDEKVYGYGRLWQYYRWTTPLEFELFAAKKQPDIIKAGTETKPIKKAGKRVGSRKIPVTRFVSDWSDDIPVQVNSMVLTENVLFVAGPPDVEDEEQSVKTLLNAETQRKLTEQSAAFEGKRGCLLVAVSRNDGRKLASYRLDFVPRFDGLIAANGRLYISTSGGEVLCLSDAKGAPLASAEKQVLLSARTD